MPNERPRSYAVAADLMVLVKSGGRFSRNAMSASFASADRTCALNSSFSAFIAALTCGRNGSFRSRLPARARSLRERWSRSEFRHHSEIDERHLELRAFAGVGEVTVQQHGCAAADGGPMNRRDKGLVEIDQRIHELRPAEILPVREGS